MSTDQNRELVRRFYMEVMNAGDLSQLDAFVSLAYVDHDLGPLSQGGPELIRTQLKTLRQIFPDFSLEIEDIIAEGDRIVTRVSIHGTHQGKWGSIEPTGIEIRSSGINIDRVVNGQIIEHWGEADMLGILVQIGVNPFA